MTAPRSRVSFVAPNAPSTLGIGELSRRTGRSVHTLRWYEKEGLIPHVARDAGGRRVYTERHVLWMRLLGKLRATGMSVSQIREYADLIRAGDATLDERIELLSRHRLRVEAQRTELDEALELIDVKLDSYREWLRAGASPIRSPAPPADEPAAPEGRP